MDIVLNGLTLEIKNLKFQILKKLPQDPHLKIAKLIDDLYKLIIKVGTHRSPSIKVAEAAKVIENTQRDLNIALVNEFSILFNKMNIDTQDVLNAAGVSGIFYHSNQA